MANWDNLKASIAEVIKTNGNQEITGQILQNVLNSIVSNVGKNATFAGIATPETNPGTPDGPVFYLACTPGIYSNFAGLRLYIDVYVIYTSNNSWNTIGLGVSKYYSEINISLYYPTGGIDGTNKYTLSTAISRFPGSLRRTGIRCAFVNSDEVVEIWEFQGGTFDDINNWKEVGSRKISDIDSIVNSIITIGTPSDITNSATEGYRSTKIGSPIGNVTSDSGFLTLLETAESGVMYEVKGRGGGSGRLYAKIKNNIVIETSNSGNEANTTFRIICDGTFDQICFNSRKSLFSCKKSVTSGVYKTISEMANSISDIQDELDDIPGNLGDTINSLSQSLERKANLETSKNIFNAYGTFSYVEESGGSYTLVKSDGTEEVFTPGVKVDTFPDEIIKNIRIHPFNGFQYISGTNYIVSRKYNLRENNYVVSGGTASSNSSNIAYFDNIGNYLGTNTSRTSYVVDKSLFPTASYFRFCSYNSDLSGIQLEVGSVATEYEEYKNEVPKSELPTDIMYNDGGNTYYRVAQYLEERKTAIRDIYRPLKIFFLGNSFSVQSSEYFVKLCEHYNLNVLVGISYVGGATLQAYDEFYGDNPSYYYKYLNHKWLYKDEYPKEISNMEKLKDTDFDIIFMQQSSVSADDYSTYQPYGTNLYQKIKTAALYKEFKMAYLMPWAWTDKRLESNSTVGGSTTNQEMYNKILAATQSMITDLSFDFVSPNGAAIQNLYSQGYTQNDVFGVGGDGQHLSSKKALFTAGLTLFRTLIPGYYDINMDTLSYEDEDITSSDFEKIDAAVKGAISLFEN